MRVRYALASVLLISAGLLLLWLDSVLRHQRQVIRDQRIYIEAGCNGRYQGEE